MPVIQTKSFIARIRAMTAGIIMLAGPAAGQPASIYFDHYTTTGGLANNTIWSITHSWQGYVWLGTQDGLCRFDGTKFKTFHYSASDTNSISNNTVYTLLEDDEKYLWIGTFNGLAIYNPAFNSFRRIKNGTYLEKLNTTNTTIGALALTSPGNKVWVGTYGLYIVNRVSMELEPAPGQLNKDLFSDGGSIRAIYAESEERIWIGSNRGFILFNGKTGAYKVYYTPQKRLLPEKQDYLAQCITPGNDGKLWLGTWGLGVLSFDTAQKKFSTPFLPVKSDGFRGATNIIQAIATTGFPGQEDLLWCASYDAGFLVLNKRTGNFTRFQTDNPDSRNGVFGSTFSLYYHPGQGLWIGSEKGLYRYDMRMQLFTTHVFRYLFPTTCLNYVSLLYADPLDSSGNTIWAGTSGYGLYQYNLRSDVFAEVPPWLQAQLQRPGGTAYTCMLRDHDGVLWTGTSSDGLITIDEKQKRAAHYFRDDGLLQRNIRVNDILEDDAGRLWVATSRGIAVLSKDRSALSEVKWNVTPAERDLLSRNVSGLCRDMQGNIWFIAQDRFNERLPVAGMCQKNNFNAAIFYHKPGNAASFPDVKVVTDITCDNGNRIWCSSWNGLIHWGAGTARPSFILQTTDDGLLNNFINVVEKDAAGNIWCGTIGGVCEVQGGGRNISSFVNNGLDHDDVDQLYFNARQNKLIIGGWGRLHTIDPRIVNYDTTIPVMSITDFRVFNKSADEIKKKIFDKAWIKLAHDRNVVTIDFALFSYYNPLQIKYACKMEGVDKDWVFTSNTSVTYNLGSGHYTFRVKAMSASGVWNEAGTYMTIVVEAPLWKRPWFLGLACLLLIMLLTALYKFRIRQLKKMQAIRNNISRDLHDDIGASLSTINILNELAKRNVADPEKVKSYLVKSGEDIQRISESLSDIVWNINPRYDDIGNLFIRMKRYAADMMDGKSISYQIDFPEAADRFLLPMEKRRDLFLVFKEAVNNLVKYSAAQNALLRITIEGKKMIMQVIDDGTGFEKEKTTTGNGLHNMEQRAAAMGAQFNILSAKGKGTAITVEMMV